MTGFLPQDVDGIDSFAARLSETERTGYRNKAVPMFLDHSVVEANPAVHREMLAQQKGDGST
jgi:hypothetical protein